VLISLLRSQRKWQRPSQDNFGVEAVCSRSARPKSQPRARSTTAIRLQITYDLRIRLVAFFISWQHHPTGSSAVASIASSKAQNSSGKYFQNEARQTISVQTSGGHHQGSIEDPAPRRNIRATCNQAGFILEVCPPESILYRQL
jgi:hypothetical protein